MAAIEGSTDKPQLYDQNSKPELVIGWVLGVDLQDSFMLEAYAEARAILKETLRTQFPDFDWKMPSVERRAFLPRGALAPLPLLDMGVEEKLLGRWDYALVLVPNELVPRHLTFTMGIPSSALEVAIMSSARLGVVEELPEKIAALALHLLGHLFALEHEDEGAMHAPELETLALQNYSPEQIIAATDHLHEVTDARLEEIATRFNRLQFYVRVFLSDPRSIWNSIIGYRPWLIPLYLGRFTAAVVVSLLVLLLTAESWEAGANMQPLWLVVGVLVSIIASTLFIYYGQSLDQVGRGNAPREQLARSRIVVLGTLLFGMTSLFFVLLVLLFGLTFALPVEVISGWAGYDPERLPRLRYSTFMAMIGVLAGALGGNLEDEEEIHAELLYDEET